MTLADHYAAATGKYGLFNAKFVYIGKPKGLYHKWQNCVIRSENNEFQLSIYYDPALPKLEVSQNEIGKEYEFRLKVKQNGNFKNMTGHINGPRKEHEHAKSK